MRCLIALTCLMTVGACSDSQRLDRGELDQNAAIISNNTSMPETPGVADIIQAMDAVPNERKGQFQLALACEAKRHAAKHSKALDIDAAYLAQLNERLVRDPGIASC